MACVKYLSAALAFFIIFGISCETDGQEYTCPENCDEYLKNQANLDASLSRFQDVLVRLEKENIDLRERLKTVEESNASLMKKAKRQSKKINDVEEEIESLRIRQWGNWSDWSMCSASCGWGTKLRTRACIGKERWKNMCTGESTEKEPCSERTCPAVPTEGWTDWTAWSGCDVSCGVGTKVKTRRCVGSMSNCVGINTSRLPCFSGTCRRAGMEWGRWGEWSECTVTCGRGTIQRTRSCIRGRGKCRGESKTEAKCYKTACPGEKPKVDKECTVAHKDKCYVIIDAGAGRERPGHERLCSEYDGHLANIYDKEQFEKLNSYIIGERSIGSYLWTGMDYTTDDGFTLHDGNSGGYIRWMSAMQPAGHWLWTGILFYANDDSRKILGIDPTILPRAGYRNMEPSSPYQYSICEFKAET